jgi:dCTP deaminase
MILSGRDLKWYIDQKLLVIDPVMSEQFQQNGIDSILEECEDGRLKIYNGMFTLGRTRERFELPNDLMAFVQLRSTWARKGFMLPPTIVDAGFKGTLTLEIASFKEQKLPIGERFAHLIFAKLTSPSEPYNGKYQNQFNITEAIKDK